MMNLPALKLVSFPGSSRVLSALRSGKDWRWRHLASPFMHLKSNEFHIHSGNQEDKKKEQRTWGNTRKEIPRRLPIIGGALPRMACSRPSNVHLIPSLSAQSTPFVLEIYETAV